MSTPSLYDHYSRVARKTTKWSNYFAIYETLFAKYRGKPITFVEVGVLNGGSLQMWRSFLGSEARIIGVDLNSAASEMEQEGFEVFIGDQSDPEFWRSFFASVGTIDVLVDDGGHTNLQQIVTLAEAIPHVADGGIVVTEDTHTSYISEGFGNPSRYSFINFAKHIVDVVNARHPWVARARQLQSLGLARAVYSVQFFDSVVAFHINRALTHESTPTTAGTLTFTQDDYRHGSRATAYVSGLRGRYQAAPRGLRSLLAPLRVAALMGYALVGRARVGLENRRARRFFR
jgi:hypothetical protein